MRKTKRVLSFVICLALVFTLFGVSAFADASKTNMTLSISPTKVQEGETVTIVISNNSMKVSSFTGGISYDTDMLKCTSIKEGETEVDVISTVEEAEKAGTVGFAIIGFKESTIAEGVIATVKLTALKTGTTTITLYEDSAGTDGYKSDSAKKENIEIVEKHNLTKVAAKAATCTEAGYKEYYKCSDCGKLFSDANAEKEISAPETVAALGHKMTKTAAKAATCTADGNKEYYICSTCSKIFSDQDGKTEIKKADTVIKATGHNWGEWTVTKAATETEKGTETRVCKNDKSHVETRDIPATGKHTLSKTAAKAATCTADGNKEYWTCSGCGKIFADQEGKTEIKKADTVVKATGHDWGEWTVTKAATETEKGTETRVCKNDKNHVETRDIPALGCKHDLKETAAKAATCTADGNRAYWTCSKCGLIFSDKDGKTEIKKADTVIKATGHDWGAWTVTKEATETEDGVKTRTCKNDKSHVETKTIPATGVEDITITPEVSKGGKIDPVTATVKPGSDKTFTVTPDEGYEIASVTVDGKEVEVKDNKFIAENLSEDTAIKVVFKEKAQPEPEPEPEAAKYTDVKAGAWYYDAVYYCTEKGYVNGVGNNRFAPGEPVTRATIAQIIFAMEGKPAGAKSAGFKDVTAGKWYTDAVNWCASKGIVAGYNSNAFGPDDPVTRQQVATILYQYAKYKNYDVSAKGDLSKFKDAGNVTAYAVTPMKWAVGHGLISGTDQGLEPRGTATRAQIAVILQAFDKNVKK